MKRASRFMPKHVPLEGLPTVAVWAISALLLVGIVLLVWNFPLFLVLIPPMGIWIYRESKRQRRKFEALAEERRELSICDFARSFDCREIDTWVIRAVYEELQGYMNFCDGQIRIKADDNLFEFLEIDEEDLDMDILEKIAQRTGRSINNTEANPYYGKISTVRDLVGFINA